MSAVRGSPTATLVAFTRAQRGHVSPSVALELARRLDAAELDLAGYRRALVAHHDLATLSDEVIRSYDWRECPVCARARDES